MAERGEVKVGDLVRVKSDAKQEKIRGEKFRVTRLVSYQGGTKDYVEGDGYTQGVWLKDVELFNEIDRTRWADVKVSNDRVRVARNSSPDGYGHDREREYGVFLSAGATGMSTEDARTLAAALVALADRIDKDVAITEREEKEKGERNQKRAEILAQIEVLRQQAEAL